MVLQGRRALPVEDVDHTVGRRLSWATAAGVGPHVRSIVTGDRVLFAMAGAYAWNISHHAFLMHPQPGFHVLDDPAA